MPPDSPTDELKFTVHALFGLPELTDPEHGVVVAAPRPRQTLRATYHDTADLRLAREGITLRHRTGEGAPVWTLALPEAGEIFAPGAAREVPAELRDLLVAWLRGASLGPVATLRTSRTLVVLCGESGEQLAEVVDDSVSVLEGRRVLERFREVELVLTGLSGEAGAEIRRRLVDAGATDAHPLPRVVRALGPRAAGPGDVPAPAVVRSSDPASALITAAIRASIRRLLHSDIGVRRQEEDGVHQMRVSCRRLRSDLKTFRALVEPLWGESLRAELKWLADSLGDARDLEVLRERLRGVVDAESALPYDSPAFDRLDHRFAQRETGALAVAADALRSERYLRLLDALVDAAREPVLSPTATERCSKILPPLVRKAWDSLEKRAARLRPGDPDADWHEARIRAKQARYAAEAVTDVLGRPAVRLSAAAKAVQTVLGEHQDGAIAAETLADLAETTADDGPLCFVAGRLAEWNRGDVARTRREFPAIWKKAARMAR
jgi:CHAD domain-containing protein